MLLFVLGFPDSSVGKESACNAGDPVQSWVRKICWRKEKLSTPVFWPGEFHGLYSPWGLKESDMTEWLSSPLPMLVMIQLQNILFCFYFIMIAAMSLSSKLSWSM